MVTLMADMSLLSQTSIYPSHTQFSTKFTTSPSFATMVVAALVTLPSTSSIRNLAI